MIPVATGLNGGLHGLLGSYLRGMHALSMSHYICKRSSEINLLLTGLQACGL